MTRWIDEAARQAVKHEGVDAVILFGSRARGGAHEMSDWDVCMVGTQEPKHIEAVMGLIEWRHEAGRVDVLWRDRDALRDDTSAGTVWADVVRHGRVLAGDRRILNGIEIKPMKRSQVILALGTATQKIETAVLDARRATAASPRRQVRAEIEGTEASAAAAEHLSRGLLGLVGLQTGSGHDVETNANVLRTAAQETADPDRARTLRALAGALARTNGGTHHAHSATYTGEPEPRERWEGRIAEVARTYAEVVEGVMHGTGPLAGLGRIAERTLAREIVTEEAQAACETCRYIEEAGTEHLRASTREALKGWRSQWERVARAGPGG